MQSRRTAGFTILELMVTVAVAAILSSLALPSFSEYLMRGRIPQATAQLLTMHMRLEQYFQDNRTYAGAPVCSTAGNTYFDFSCPVQDAEHIVLQASGKGAMANFLFTIDEQGVMRTAGVPAGWRLPDSNCWVLRRSGQC